MFFIGLHVLLSYLINLEPNYGKLIKGSVRKDIIILMAYITRGYWLSESFSSHYLQWEKKKSNNRRGEAWSEPDGSTLSQAFCTTEIVNPFHHQKRGLRIIESTRVTWCWRNLCCGMAGGFDTETINDGWEKLKRQNGTRTTPCFSIKLFFFFIYISFSGPHIITAAKTWTRVSLGQTLLYYYLKWQLPYQCHGHLSVSETPAKSPAPSPGLAVGFHETTTRMGHGRAKSQEQTRLLFNI